MSGKAATAAVKHIAKQKPSGITVTPRDVVCAALGALGISLFEPSERLKAFAKSVAK